MGTLWWACSMIFLLTFAVLQTVVYSDLGYSSIACGAEADEACQKACHNIVSFSIFFCSGKSVPLFPPKPVLLRKGSLGV